MNELAGGVPGVRVRTLVVAENLPYPTFKGGDLRAWQNVNALLHLGPVAVFGLCSNDRRPRVHREGLAVWERTTDPDLMWPPTAARAASSRGWPLEPDGHPSDMYYSPGAAAELERLVTAFAPDVIVVERLWLWRYIPHLRRSGARVVLDAHNVEAVLSRQLEASSGDAEGRAGRGLVVRRTEAIERRACGAVDQIWTCSERDRACVERLYGSQLRVCVVPNGVDVGGYRGPRRDTPGARPPLLVFPAMFSYAPNATAARFLVSEVLPAVRSACGDCRLALVGGMPTAFMLEAAKSDPDVVVTGAVPDVRPYLNQATVVVVPLFEGSGTRYKILEAFAAGVPVVTTPVGAEGLDVVDGVHALVAHTADDFAAAARRLAEDGVLVDRLTASARALVADRYSWDAARDRIAAALASLCAEMPA